MYEYFIKLVVPKGVNKVFIHADLECGFDSTEELKRLLQKNTVYFVYVYLNDFPAYDHVSDAIKVTGVSSLIETVRTATIKIKNTIDSRNRYLTLPAGYEVTRVQFDKSSVYGDKTFISVEKTDDPYAGVNMTKIATELCALMCKGNTVALLGEWIMYKENDGAYLFVFMDNKQ